MWAQCIKISPPTLVTIPPRDYLATMYSHHYLTFIVCLSWTLAASQRCSKTIEYVCDNSNATEKSQFYALQLSSQEYSTTEKGKTQISGEYDQVQIPTSESAHLHVPQQALNWVPSFGIVCDQDEHFELETICPLMVVCLKLTVQVKMTATCLTLKTPGPKYYKLEAYSKSSSEPVGIFNTPHQLSEAERCANNVSKNWLRGKAGEQREGERTGGELALSCWPGVNWLLFTELFQINWLQEIVFSSCDPKVTDLPRVYGWDAPNVYVGDICFRWTIIH